MRHDLFAIAAGMGLLVIAVGLAFSLAEGLPALAEALAFRLRGC